MFVRALDYDANTQFREPHEAACTRAGLLATPPLVLLSSTPSAPLLWGAAAAASAVAQLGDAQLSVPPVSGCCSNSMYCWRNAAGSARPYTCGIHGAGSLTFSNTGWTANSSLTPVFACVGPMPSPSALPAFAARLPVAGAARFVTDPLNYAGVRLRIDGVNLSTQWPQATQVYVGGVSCRDVEPCHFECGSCSSDADCGRDTVCERFGSVSYCLRRCDWPSATSFTCPCGGRCYSVTFPGRTPSTFCLNPSFDLNNMSTLCTGANEFTPALSSGWNQRLECTPSWPIISPGHSTPVGPPPWYPFAPGPGLTSVVLTTSASGAAGGGRLRARRRALWQHSTTLTTAANYPSETEKQDEEGGALKPLPGDANPRSLLSTATTTTTTTTTTLMGGATPLSGYRYGGVCNATSALLLSVIVVRNGLASTGLGVAAGASAGLVPNASTFVPPGSPFFTALGYMGGVPALPAPGLQCVRDADCGAVDGCSVPRCLAWSPTTNSTVAGNASIPGCCVYLPSGACDSGDFAPAEVLYTPASVNYVPLPREVAAAVAIPPPPVGGMNDQNPSASNKLAASDMSIRDPTINPTAFSWDAASVWYSNPAAVGPSGSAHVFAPYVLSPYASSDDNGPPDVVNLGLNVTLWGVTSSVLRVSPNGYFRNAPTDALVCADGFGSPPPLTCDYFNDYEGILGPLVYNFNPGFYGDAFTYVGAWDASAEAQISTGAPLSSAAVACAVWLNTGLNVQPASPFPPPNPSYSFMGCVHGDGGVRWRYGQVLGVPGYVVGAWGPTDTVSSYGGPPNVTLPGDRWSPGWLAGVRSASSSAAAAETDYVHDLPPLLDSPPPSPGALSDIAQRSNAQVTLSRSGVRQGATAAACQISPIACATPACGGTGTVVTLTWGGIGCGLGFDALGVPGATTAVSLPRVECVFGGVPTLAVLVRAAATAGGSGGGGAGVWACTAPDRSSFNGTYGTTSAFTVPLRLQLIAPTEPAGYAPLLRPSTVYAPFGVPDPSSGIGDEAVVAFARGAAGGGPNSASALVPLDVYGVGVAPSCNGSSSSSSTGGGVSSSACSVAPPSPPSATTTTTSTTFLLPREMSFSYGATGPGGALTCGCSASSPAAVCDACGVCGGSGSFTDCAGVCFGTAFIDACGNCSGGSTGTIPDAAKDCDGVCGGRNWACAVAAQSSSSAADSQEVTLNIIVISALITCSVALVIMIVYFAWMAILRHRHERDAILEFLTLEDLGIPPGLSEASRSALPIVSYHPKTAECADIGEHDTCSICMDKYAEGEPVRLLPTCKHAFHVACLDKWLERATQCPVCRAELRSDAERAEVEAAQERLRYRGTRTHHHHPAAGGAGGAGAPRVTLTVQMGPTMTRPVRVQPSPRRSQSPLSARSTGGGAVTSAAAPVAVDGSSSTQQQRNTHPPLPTPGLRPAPAAGSTGVSASSVHVEGVDAGGSGGSAYASVSDAGGPSRASRAGEGGAAAGNRAMRRARSSGGGHGSGSGSGTGLPREDSSSSNSSSSTTSNGGGGGGVDGTSSASDGRGRRGGGGGGGPNRNRRENESPTSAAAGASASSPARRAASATGSGSSFSSPNRAGGGGAGPSSPPGMSNRSSFISGRRIMHSMDDGVVDGNDDDGDVDRGGDAATTAAADGSYYDVSGLGVGVGVGSQHPPRREGGGGGARRAGGAPLSQQQLLLQQQRQSPNIELASSSHAAYGGGGGGNSSNNSLGSSGGVNGGGSGGSIGSNGSPSATRPPRAISAHTTTPNSRSVLSSNAPKDAYSSPHGGPYTAWIDETGTLIALDNPLHSSRSRNVASTHSAMSLPGSAPHSR